MQSLITKRCFLTDYAEDDQADFVALNADPRVREHMGGVLSEAEAEALFRETLDDTDPRQGVRWAIFDRKTDCYLGHFFFVPWETPDQVEMGILLQPDYWGQGLGTEVTWALMQQGFSSMPIKSILATADRSHVAAQNLLQKLGMKRYQIGQDDRGLYDVFRITRAFYEKSPLHQNEDD